MFACSWMQRTRLDWAWRNRWSKKKNTKKENISTYRSTPINITFFRVLQKPLFRLYCVLSHSWKQLTIPRVTKEKSFWKIILLKNSHVINDYKINFQFKIRTHINWKDWEFQVSWMKIQNFISRRWLRISHITCNELERGTTSLRWLITEQQLEEVVMLSSENFPLGTMKVIVGSIFCS